MQMGKYHTFFSTLSPSALILVGPDRQKERVSGTGDSLLVGV